MTEYKFGDKIIFQYDGCIVEGFVYKNTNIGFCMQLIINQIMIISLHTKI